VSVDTDGALNVTARSGPTGAALWSRHLHPVAVPGDFDQGHIGDVDGDTIADLAFGDTFINGRTGAVTTHGLLGLPLFAAVDGTGDDFAYTNSDDNKTWTVTVNDGRTGTTIFTYALNAWDDGRLTAADVTGDRRAEVFGYFVPVPRTGPDGKLVAINAATHKLLWSAKP
jgi:hypothetical protein